MADTQRTRAQILAIFADNVTGQINAQDNRDFIVTVMESEFLNPGDFWKQPSAKHTTTDADARGWIDYSQTVGSDCSAFNVLYLTASGEWMRADVADSSKTALLGMALDSYTSDTATAQILRDGVVYYSAWSALFSDNVGRPIYLDSGVPGSISMGSTDNSVKIIGVVEASDTLGTAIGKMRFKADWSVKGS